MKFKEERPLYLLEEIAMVLRGEKGCAWDREQTHESLKPYLIEEAYEACEAIEKKDDTNLREELGDLLYQVYAHAQIAREEGRFTIDDVARAIAEKLINRHPHVFGNETASTAQEVIERWEKIKKKEKAHRESILDGVPAQLPSLLKAYRVQQKASRIGFDWGAVEGAVKKLDEEVAEFKEALAQNAGNDRAAIEGEIGDVLFSVVNASRLAGVNPEDALGRTVEKFMRRFKFIERDAASRGGRIEEMSLEEMDALWEEAKRRERE